MTEESDVRFEPDGSMTITGATFEALAALARDLGVSPEEALRRAVARAEAALPPEGEG
jgi:hypothetical protein